jgi:hypothetical protein
MPDTETLDVPLSGINPDLQLSLNSGKLTHYLLAVLFSEAVSPKEFVGLQSPTNSWGVSSNRKLPPK